MGCKIFLQERARFCYAFATHFQDQMVFVFVAIIAHRFRQMIWQNFADQLHEFIGKMLRQEADFFTESIDTRFKIKQFRQLVRTEFLNHIECIFTINGSNIKSMTMDILTGNRQVFKLTQSSTTDIGQLINIICTDIENGSLFFLWERIQAYGKHHQLARAT